MDPEKDDWGSFEVYLSESLKINREQRRQLVGSQVESAALKQENTELRRMLNKAESERDWMHSINKQAIENEVCSSDIAVVNAQKLIRTIAKLRADLSTEKRTIAQLSADLNAEKLCFQVEKDEFQRRLKATARTGRTGKTSTAEASTCVDSVSGDRTRWADLYERDDFGFE
jgi:hypothetical protein